MGQEENKICHICRKPNGYFPEIDPNNSKSQFSDSVYIKSESADFVEDTDDTKHFLSDSDTNGFASDANDFPGDINEFPSAKMSTTSHKHHIFGDLTEPSNVKLEPRDDFSSEDYPQNYYESNSGSLFILI